MKEKWYPCRRDKDGLWLIDKNDNRWTLFYQEDTFDDWAVGDEDREKLSSVYGFARDNYISNRELILQIVVRAVNYAIFQLDSDSGVYKDPPVTVAESLRNTLREFELWDDDGYLCVFWE